MTLFSFHADLDDPKDLIPAIQYATGEGRLVAAPRIAASPAHFECKLTQIVRLLTKNVSKLDQWLLLGEAVGIHIDNSLIENGFLG